MHPQGHLNAMAVDDELPAPVAAAPHPNPPSERAPTIYMPIASPPTPAPSPRPTLSLLPAAVAIHNQLQPGSSQSSPGDIAHLSRLEFASLQAAAPTVRQQYLVALLSDCTPAELLFVSTTVAQRLKRDFLRELPAELALQVLSYVEDPRTMARAGRVSQYWNKLVKDEANWKRMCEEYEFRTSDVELETKDGNDMGIETDLLQPRIQHFSYMKHFRTSYQTLTNWRRGGRQLRTHKTPSSTADGGVVTSVALDDEWIVVGLANCRIHVFSAKTGVLSRTLIGHESGVWAVNLVSRGGHWVDPPSSSRPTPSPPGNSMPGPDATGDAAPMYPSDADYYDFNEKHIPATLRTAIGLDRLRASSNGPSVEPSEPRPSDVCSASEGWGQANALVVSGGCDKVLRVWDVKSGYCIYILRGHTSTVRCLKVLHNRPIAVSGSRDMTLRVWDVQKGVQLRVLQGHEESVRCLDVCGNLVVSGSYDCTCRLWNIDTGECLQVLRGHYHQIYSVAFDGKHIASGGLDTTVRVWNPKTGECLAILQGHTALVCQLQLFGDILATGGSDGRVITFSLSSMTVQQRLAAHDSSVAALQYSPHFLVTAGNDGHVRLWDARAAKDGRCIRELTLRADAVWKVAHRADRCVITCRRFGKTVVEIWSFRPDEEGEDMAAASP